MKHMSYRVQWTGSLAISALILAALACGSQPGAQAPSPQAPTSAPSGGGAGSPIDSLDPCALLTQDDASAFFGAPSVAGHSDHGSNTAFCLYQTADNASTLSLNLEYDPGGALKADDFLVTKSGVSSGDSQAVPGLGDEAYLDLKVHFLVVAKGPWMVRVSGSAKGTLAGLDALKPLAQKALSRLPQ